MINIKDVASEAEVSTSTVSHVINKTRFVSKDTEKKVLKAVKKLKYYPNIQARGLVLGKTNIIGLVVSDISNPFFPEIILEIEKNATKRSYDIFLTNTNYDTSRTASLVRRFIEKKVNGVIILTTEIENKLIKELASREIPIVLLDWGIVDYFASNIKINFVKGIEEAIDHLAELGHKNIGFVYGPQNLKSAKRRKEIFLTTVSKYKKVIKNSVMFEGGFNIDGGEFTAVKILNLRRRPTAIITSNDVIAIGAIHKFREAGLRIPGDISIIGLDNILISKVVNPPLTTINIPKREIGKLAWDMLLCLFKDDKKKGIETIIDTNLIVRNTTSPN